MSSSKRNIVVVIIILVLLTCCCVTSTGFAGYYFYNKSKTRNNSADKDTEQDTTSDKDTDIEDTSNPLLYTNSKYSFSIEFPAGWEDFEVDETEGSEAAGFVAMYSFALPSKSYGDFTLFDITIYTEEQWEPYNEYFDIWGNSEKLGTKGDYVYIFSHINASPPEDLQDKMLDLDAIKDSFELLT